MPKNKTLVVRCDESLLDLIKATSVILDRKESETIRILLTRACKYWILKGKINNSLPDTPEIKKITITDTWTEEQELELKKLQEGMNNLK